MLTAFGFFFVLFFQAESRAKSAGLGTKSASFVPGDDYRTYIKRMMKSRYEQI